MKIALAVIMLLAAAGAIGMGIISAPAAAAPARIPAVVMRALPGQPQAPIAVAAVAKAVVPAAKAHDELEGLGARPAQAKPAEAKPAEAKPAEAKPAEAKPAEPADEAAKPAEAKPAAVANKPAPPVNKPPPTAVAPAPAAGGAAPAAAGGTEGSLNLRASDTADVYIDGRKVGGSPVLGHRVKAGKHKVRFDCYDPSGEAKQGIVQTVDVGVDGERDVEYECPAP